MWSFFFFKQKTAYEMRISDWSSDVCSSDLQNTARMVGNMVGQRRVVFEYIMIEQVAPQRLLPGRQVADRQDRVIERRLRLPEPGGGVAPPIVDKDVERIEPFDMVPPHRTDEDRVTGIQIGRANVRTPVTNETH